MNAPDAPEEPNTRFVSPSLEALKVVARLRQAREAALAAFSAADRALHDAEQELQAVRLLSKTTTRYSH